MSKLRCWLSGGSGLVGSAISKCLRSADWEVSAPTSQEVDLRNLNQVRQSVLEFGPDLVIMAGAKVGGVLANQTAPASFILDNLTMQNNVFSAARELQVERLIFLSSSCVYPHEASLPFQENSILGGPLHHSVRPYGIAKLAGMEVVRSVFIEDGLNWSSVIPCNVYGPGDNFSLHQGHVLASLLRKFHEAKISDSDFVEVWGSGIATREFIHSTDAAAGIMAIVTNYNDVEPVNLGTGIETSVAELAAEIQDVVGFEGSIRFNSALPEGALRKVQDHAKLRNLGWSPKYSLSRGIESTYSWFLDQTKLPENLRL